MKYFSNLKQHKIVIKGRQLVILPLQSFISTMPKMWSSTFSMLIGSPSLLPGPTKNAISSSKSNSLHGPKTGGWAGTTKIINFIFKKNQISMKLFIIVFFKYVLQNDYKVTFNLRKKMRERKKEPNK